MTPRAAKRPSRSRSRGREPAAVRAIIANPTTSRGATILLMGVAVLALALRLWHLHHGLPDFLEEAIPFRRALGMWRNPAGHVDPNPRFFQYPSLTLYLHLAVQQIGFFLERLAGAVRSPADWFVSFETDPTPMVIPARLIHVLADLVVVLGAARIAERIALGAGPIAAALVAVAPTLIVTSRAIFTDTIMTAFAIAALERTIAYAVDGGRARLLVATALIGLAAGAKYPGAALMLPLAMALIARHGLRGVALAVVAGAGALAVFLATTPYALLDGKTLGNDLAFVGRMTSQGHFGNIGRAGFAYHLGNLARDLGWLGVAALPVSLVLTLGSLRRTPTGSAIGDARRVLGAPATLAWIALLVFGVPISLAHVEAERYLVPVIPIAAALVAAAFLTLTAPLRRRSVPWFALAVVALLLPPVFAGVKAGASGGTTTQITARRWVEAHLLPDDLLVQELYGAAVTGRIGAYSFMSRPLFAAASPDVQRRYRERRWFPSVTLPLTAVGRAAALVRRPDGRSIEIEVSPHGSDLNTVPYDPRLYAGVDYVLTSASVRGRFEADPARYVAPLAFYALLDSTAEVAARFRPHAGDTGPEIVIYRLGPRARAAIDAAGPLDPLWWTAVVPRTYRERAEALLAPGRAPNLEPREPDGEPAPWVASLSELYRERFEPYVLAMATEHREHGRPALARGFAQSILETEPGHVGACLLAVDAAKRLGDWPGARRTLERALRAYPSNAAPPVLRLEYADALERAGERDRARAELEAVVNGSDPALASEARQKLEAAPR
jgi:hypothetical protein